jgi:hypothetical protein
LDGDRSAALLIRVWLEDGTRDFRGRLATIDTSPGPRGGEEATVALASSPSEVIAAVHEWLDAFLGGASDPIDTEE